jgi:hypothetical protein
MVFSQSASQHVPWLRLGSMAGGGDGRYSAPPADRFVSRHARRLAACRPTALAE